MECPPGYICSVIETENDIEAIRLYGKTDTMRLNSDSREDLRPSTNTMGN